MPTTVEAIAALLSARNIAGFMGLHENQWFDAKGAAAYDLATQAGRLELAKDASSFANAEGGYIIVGLTTTQVSDQQTDEISGLDFLTKPSFNVAQIEGVLAEYLYPEISGLEVSWVEDASANGLGVGVIAIPELPHDSRLVLMKQAFDDAAVRQIVFGFAVRKGAHSIPNQVQRIHQMCQEGRSTAAERLTRIEGKIDSLLHQEGGTAVAAQESAFADVAQSRVQGVLGNE